MIKIFIMRKIFLTILTVFLVSFELMAQANVTFSESELIFHGRMRSAKLTLVNRGDETATVTLKYLQPVFKAKTDKNAIDSSNMVDVKKIELTNFPYNLKLDKALRITPRRVKLEPGEKQVVRLILRKPVDLLDGVYRANIAIEYIDVVHEKLQQLKPDNNKVSAVGMGFVTAIHIPLMIIHGDVNVELNSFRVISVTKRPDEKINPNVDTDISIEYDQSGNSIGQYRLVIYPENDKDNILYNKTFEVSNFKAKQVKSYGIILNDSVKKLKFELRDLGSDELVKETTYDLKQNF